MSSIPQNTTNSQIQFIRPPAFCGKPVGRYHDPRTGAYVSWKFYCRNWRFCPTCREWRRKYIKGRIMTAMREAKRCPVTRQERNRQIVCITVSDAEARKIMREYGQDNTMILPQNDDMAFVVYDVLPCLADELAMPPDEEIDTLSDRTPRGKGCRRMSGKLGKRNGHSREPRPANAVDITTRSWLALPPPDDSKVRQDDVFYSAARELGQPDTSSQTVLQRHIDAVHNLARERLTDKGFYLTGERERKTWCVLANVDWRWALQLNNSPT